MSESDDLEVLQVVRGNCTGLWKNVVILSYETAPHAVELQARQPLLDRLVAEQSEAYLLSLINMEKMPSLPSSDARAVTKAQLAQLAPILRSSAIAVIGGGTSTMLARSVLRMFHLGSQSKRFFSSADIAIRWLAGQRDPSSAGASTMALTRAVAELEAARTAAASE